MPTEVLKSVEKFAREGLGFSKHRYATVCTLTSRILVFTLS
jgi:hypothetical protein